jgi:uncharacterized membrane protein YhaH (DUF805 family)
MDWISSYVSGERTLGRQRYFLYGLLFSLVKWNLDRLIAGRFFMKWTLFEYWSPVFGSLRHASENPQQALTFFFVAVPFIALGTALTLNRLRDAGLPPGLVLLFFVPYVNLMFFTVLCVLPSKQPMNLAETEQSGLARWLPQSDTGAAVASVLISTLLCVVLAVLSVRGLLAYGWGLFMGAPFVIGFVTAMLLNHERDRGLPRTIAAAMSALLLAGVVLFGFAVEGVICLLMSVPIAIPLGLLGSWLGCAVQRQRTSRPLSPLASAVMIAMLPLAMHVDATTPLQSVTTEVVIAASPDEVWKNVVAFAPLPEPRELMFKTGIAYPTEATIVGSGVGAVRYCTFSTGSFIEPITAWEPGHRLSFDVTAQPPVMREWSFTEVVPAHLADHYLRSERGEFLLEALPDGSTRLIGTTWYRLRFAPQPYWQWWSGYIIHGIHSRVLEHIKRQAESARS